jgi:hypothetical protein
MKQSIRYQFEQIFKKNPDLLYRPLTFPHLFELKENKDEYILSFQGKSLHEITEISVLKSDVICYERIQKIKKIKK